MNDWYNTITLISSIHYFAIILSFILKKVGHI